MAGYKVVITEKDIENAVIYTALDGKEKLARNMARLCIEPVEVKADDDSPLPTMFRENRKLRHQFQMGVLAYLLGREYPTQMARIVTKDGATETPLTMCMDEEAYDEWAGSHVMNQIERLKKTATKETVNKIFDFLYDYKAFEMMLSGSIRDELEILNDGFNRAMQYFSVQAVDAAIKTMVSGEFARLADELKERKVEADG